jgi:hypothetical protein
VENRFFVILNPRSGSVILNRIPSAVILSRKDAAKSSLRDALDLECRAESHTWFSRYLAGGFTCGACDEE